MSGHLRITQNAKSNLLNLDFFGHSDSIQCSEFIAKRYTYAHDCFVHLDSFDLRSNFMSGSTEMSKVGKHTLFMWLWSMKRETFNHSLVLNFLPAADKKKKTTLKTSYLSSNIKTSSFILWSNHTSPGYISKSNLSFSMQISCILRRWGNLVILPEIEKLYGKESLEQQLVL